MNRTGFLYDKRYLLHDTGPYHPEMGARLEVIYQGIEAAGLLPHLISINPTPASRKWVEAVHDSDYIRRFEEVCLAGHTTFECQDNTMCRETYETALLAAGGIIEAARMLMSDEIDNAFCAVRPPGHHAEQNQAMGFCYFNNVAIGARYLQQKYGVDRVGIIDYDVHHGNGTQHIFEKDPTVYYYSIHQHPSFSFPGTGREFETGDSDGTGFTKNSPILPEKSDETYQAAFKEDLVPALTRFKPEIILVSTGFDAHRDDLMSDMRVTTDGYSWMIQSIMDLAADLCGGRMISVLEGGYSLKRLPELAANHVKHLLGL